MSLDLFLLCSWSSILIFVWLVRAKFYWTAPPYRAFCVYAVVGLFAANSAALINLFIGRETELWFFSADRYESFMGFLLGAGMGEEFWKMFCGVFILLCLLSAGRDLGPAGRIVSFVVLGLSFATFENIAAYSELEFWPLLTRGVTAVPLHASMGIIHGLAVNRALARRSPWALIAGYAAAAALHTLYDTLPLIFPAYPTKLLVFPFIAILLMASLCLYLRVPELSADLLVEPDASPAENLDIPTFQRQGVRLEDPE